MTEHEALQLVSDLNGKSFDDMLAAATAKGHDEMDVKLRFQSLWQQGYITGVFQFGYPVTLYQAGLDRLAEHQRNEQLTQQSAEEAAKLKAEKRSEKKLVIVGILVPAVFSALALVVDLLGILPPDFFATLWDRIANWVEQLVQRGPQVNVTFHQLPPIP